MEDGKFGKVRFRVRPAPRERSEARARAGDIALQRLKPQRLHPPATSYHVARVDGALGHADRAGQIASRFEDASLEEMGRRQRPVQ